MNENQPLHIQVYQVMADRIRSGHWKEGERVPTEKELLSEFGTSRGPIRQALARLRSEGLIVGGRGAPAVIQRPIPSQSFETLTSFTDWAREIGQSPGQKTISVARRLSTDAEAVRLEVLSGAEVVEILRVRTFGEEPVMLERSLYPIELGEILLREDLNVSSIYQTLRNAGVNLTRASNTIDATNAGVFEAKWLQVDAGKALLRLHRTTYDEDGGVVDYVENLYIPNRVTFAMENTRNDSAPINNLRLVDPSLVNS